MTYSNSFRNIAFLIGALTNNAMAQVTELVDEFDGPDLSSDWTVIHPATHDGFDDTGHYLVRGPLSSAAGLRRPMGGQGDFTAEISLKLGPFFLNNSGGTQSDLKVRFKGSGASLEVVLNSFKSLRVSSSELGGNLGNPITINRIEDGDQLNLQFVYRGNSNTLSVNYALHGDEWTELASAFGIAPSTLQESEIILFKFSDSEATLPRIRLDRYEVTDDTITSPESSLELIEGTDDCRFHWSSVAGNSYLIEWSNDLINWQSVTTQVPATPPINSFLLEGLASNSKGFFRVAKQDASTWPHGDYCSMLSQEIQGKKHAFLAGNLAYYIGGRYTLWDVQEHETIGLTHPFHHDLRGRGYGLVANPTSGTGHDFQGWDFYKDSKVAYGTVIVNGQSFPHPIPQKMFWRPDQVICEYVVDGVAIREEKFISLSDVACTIITASEPIEIHFAGHSFVSNERSIERTSTISHDNTHNIVHVTEGGTVLTRPVEGTEVEGALMYDGMNTVISTSVPFSNYHSNRDADGRQHYSFKVSCGPQGVALGWAMHDTYSDACSRLKAVLADPSGHLAAKTAHMDDLLTNQIPYFRCSDPDIVNIYYYLWSLYLMYYIDVGKGWEVYPHTQTAVHNFLGMHRFDANFQIKVGAWVVDKDYYAYGNVLTWSALLPYARSGGRLPDNMGQSWLSPVWGATTDHVIGAWDIYEHSGDLGFIRDIYEPYFKPLFWNGMQKHWGASYDAIECLKQMAILTGNPDDVSHWHTVGDVDNIQRWMDSEWERSTPNYWGSTANAIYPLGTTDQALYWTGMAYMRNEWFPEDWARRMTNTWAINREIGFNGPIPPTLVAMQDIDHIFPDFASAPDLAYYSIIGMYDRHVGKIANVMGIGHLKKYNLKWGIPVAPESYDSDWEIWGDQYSNFNAGKILLILNGIAGIDYSIPDGVFEITDHMPEEWTFMELKVPITQPGQIDWIDVRIDRIDHGEGTIEKTVSIANNPLPTLKIQPWLEEKALLNAPAEGETEPLTGHLSYTFTNTPDAAVTIRMRE